MAETPSSSDLGRRLAELMNATGVKPPKIERLLRGRATAVRRTTIYNWINGSSLPLSVESLLAVVHACAEHTEVKVSSAALRSDREWTALLADAKQERDSRAGRSAQGRQRGPREPDTGNPRASEPSPPPRWEALHPVEASDRLTRLDDSDPDRAVAELYTMKPGIAYDVLTCMGHDRALSLLARVQPTWLADCASEYAWFREQLHQIPADRGVEAFQRMAWSHRQAAAWAINGMEPDPALHYLNVLREVNLRGVLGEMRREGVDRLLDRMTPDCTTVALEAHADWAAYILLVGRADQETDRQRADTIIDRIGPDGIRRVLGAARSSYVARLIKHLDHDGAATWIGRMEADKAIRVLEHVDPSHIAALTQDLDASRAAWWLARMTVAHAARVLELLEPEAAAAAIGSLERERTIRCLDQTAAAAAARVLAATANLLGLDQTAEILRGMEPDLAGAALAAMELQQCTPLLEQAGPDLVDVLFRTQVRSMPSENVAQIAKDVCARPGDTAALLARNQPEIAARIAETLPVQDAAKALASIDVHQARQILWVMHRTEIPGAKRRVSYPDRPIDQYTGKQIDILKAIEQFDEAAASRLTELLGLAPPKPPSWANR
jgi:flagellar motility protein MotE (MotC chaperone)